MTSLGTMTTLASEVNVSELDDRSLVQRAQHGDRHARERLVVRHLDEVRSIARRYRNLGLPVDDLVQEGALGLLDSIDQFDASRGPAFDVYARFRIRRAIRNALTAKSRVIRLPKQIVERRRALDRADARLTDGNGTHPSTARLAEVTGLAPDVVTEVRSSRRSSSRSTRLRSPAARRSRRSSRTTPLPTRRPTRPTARRQSSSTARLRSSLLASARSSRVTTGSAGAAGDRRRGGRASPLAAARPHDRARRPLRASRPARARARAPSLIRTSPRSRSAGARMPARPCEAKALLDQKGVSDDHHRDRHRWID